MEQAMILGIPNDPMPQQFVDELISLFRKTPIIKRAAMPLLNEGKEMMYLLVIEFDINPKRHEEALSFVVQHVAHDCNPPDDPRWPLSAGLWDRFPIEEFSKDHPEVVFYTR